MTIWNELKNDLSINQEEQNTIELEKALLRMVVICEKRA